MKKEDILALFPIEAMVTEKIIEVSDLWDNRNCIGVNTLKSVLPEELHEHITWAVKWGFLFENKGEEGRINIRTGIDMMEIREPRKVVFTIN